MKQRARKKIETRRYVVLVTEYENSVDVVIELPPGNNRKFVKTSHQKGNGDYANTVGFISGAMGVFENVD